MDNRASERMMFVAGMRGIPSITDLVTSTAVASIRNNGQRRFFQPWLIDRYGDRGAYQGQQLNAGDGSPGSVSDPNWNGRSQAAWSPDGTKIVYWQSIVTAPGCGGQNPLPCPESTEPGGRRTRLMIAHLSGRESLPVSSEPVTPISDVVPWGTPYTPGDPHPTRPYPREGNYTLRGKMLGRAEIHIKENGERTAVETVTVEYTNYSDDGIRVLNGTESVTRRRPSPFDTELDWRSDLVQSGCTTGTKLTSEDGFSMTTNVFNPVFQASGTLTTTLDGRVFRQPANGT